MQETLITIIFQTSSVCNLNCTYCYCQENKQTDARLTINTLRECVPKIDKFFDNNYKFCFLFHGGEPLLLGKQFYRDAFKAFSEFVQHAYYCGVQTNLTLLDEEFIEIFSENSCSISTSLDGHEEFHDKYRKDRSGKGTFKTVSKNARKLAERDMACGAVSVINDHNVNNPERFYSFIKEHKEISFGFSPMFLKNASGLWAVEPIALGEFFISLYDLWILDGNPAKIGFFEEIIKNLIGAKSCTICAFAPDCSEFFFTIDSLGDVYPCCHFIGREAFRYGNLLQSSFLEIINSAVRYPITQRRAYLQNICSECEFWRLCYSGCMANTDEVINTKDYFCHTYKMLFTHIRDSIKSSCELATT